MLVDVFVLPVLDLAVWECSSSRCSPGKKCEVCGETRVVWATAIAGILGGFLENI